jgi:hypothetical protein
LVSPPVNGTLSRAWWWTPVTPALERLRQKNPELEVILQEPSKIFLRCLEKHLYFQSVCPSLSQTLEALGVWPETQPLSEKMTLLNEKNRCDLLKHQLLSRLSLKRK